MEYPAGNGSREPAIIKKGKTNIRENVVVGTHDLHRSLRKGFISIKPLFSAKRWFEPRFLWLQQQKKARPARQSHYLFSHPKDIVAGDPSVRRNTFYR
jgi:hypothetical protein